MKSSDTELSRELLSRLLGLSKTLRRTADSETWRPSANLAGVVKGMIRLLEMFKAEYPEEFELSAKVQAAEDKRDEFNDAVMVVTSYLDYLTDDVGEVEESTLDIIKTLRNLLDEFLSYVQDDDDEDSPYDDDDEGEDDDDEDDSFLDLFGDVLKQAGHKTNSRREPAPRKRGWRS
jgi:hypothetical protein